MPTDAMNEAFDRVRRLAFETGLPGLEVSTSYGTPSIKVRRRFIGRMYDAEVFVLMCPMGTKDALIEAAPEIFFQTNHYAGYPALLIRLASITDAELQDHIVQAWRMQAPASLKKS